MPPILDQASLQSIQKFERIEILLDEAGIYSTLPDGRRYIDVTFVGDNIYCPPESAVVPIDIYLNEWSTSKQALLPRIYPGGSFGGIYQRARIAFPPKAGTPVGKAIIILSMNCKFSSGSVLIGAPAVVGGFQDTAYMPFALAKTTSLATSTPPIQELPFLINLPCRIDSLDALLWNDGAEFVQFEGRFFFLNGAGQKIYVGGGMGVVVFDSPPIISSHFESAGSFYPIDVPLSFGQGAGSVQLHMEYNNVVDGRITVCIKGRSSGAVYL